MSKDVAAIVPAAGAGTRFGGRVRKPFARLNGRLLLEQTIVALKRSRAVRWVVLVLPLEESARTARLIRRWQADGLVTHWCVGGASRAESVARGFAHLPSKAEWVLVHDGARPCVTAEVVRRSVRAGRRYGAAACGVPAAFTIKAVDEDRAVRLTLDRERLWCAQTPQVFRRDWFAEALTRVGPGVRECPDDAAMLEAAGFPVRMILGDPLNIKVTTREDLILARAILKSRHVDD